MLSESEIEKIRKIRRDNHARAIKFVRNIYNYCVKWLWLMLMVLGIAFIGCVAGVGSFRFIYLMNKPLGLDYAYYASYMESALIGLVLGYYILWRKK